MSPRVNLSDRATAACRRSYCQRFADRRFHVVSVTDPYGRILDFLDRSHYFRNNIHIFRNWSFIKIYKI
jgi:hypothetical protein